jgi:hypothetical protein
MRHPRVIILEADGWMARQLRELAGENRWLVHEPRSCDTALSLAREPGPVVLFVQVEPAEEKIDHYAFIAELRRFAPDVPVVAVSDVKMPDADRAAWTALLFDLGARYVLFPPLSKPVLEDLASGLMTAAIRRTIGDSAPMHKPASDVIDLADEESHR